MACGTWLFDSDLCPSGHLLRQLVPGVVGAEQPLLHMAVVAAAVSDLCALHRQAEQPPGRRALELQPAPQPLLLCVGAVLKG